jgi:subtilisin-like proprotein convertase family protein
MKMLKLTGLVALAVVLPFCAAQAQFVTNVTYTSVNTPIPDGNPVGLTSSTNISGLYSLSTVSSVTVNLDITGGFNGDLYAYLAGPGGGFAVLLNRTGITSGNSFGYSDTGFNITLSDSAANNIHLYQNDSPSYNGSGQLTQIWAPDGRNIDPQSSPSAFDSASPTADLSSFNGANPNGTWTLFVADLSSGGQGTLVSWGLTVVTVPEPQTWVLIAGGLGLLLAVNRRRKL